ncbi:hypothetical protein DFJ77DRAFT_443103 [Powellomyces hirtus]|nr:hypothetical protein DFJ77DRAFT_443103 [Powellomyces hirtus]
MTARALQVFFAFLQEITELVTVKIQSAMQSKHSNGAHCQLAPRQTATVRRNFTLLYLTGSAAGEIAEGKVREERWLTGGESLSAAPTWGAKVVLEDFLTTQQRHAPASRQNKVGADGNKKKTLELGLRKHAHALGKGTYRGCPDVVVTQEHWDTWNRSLSGEKQVCKAQREKQLELRAIKEPVPTADVGNGDDGNAGDSALERLAAVSSSEEPNLDVRCARVTDSDNTNNAADKEDDPDWDLDPKINTVPTPHAAVEANPDVDAEQRRATPPCNQQGPRQQDQHLFERRRKSRQSGNIRRLLDVGGEWATVLTRFWTIIFILFIVVVLVLCYAPVNCATVAPKMVSLQQPIHNMREQQRPDVNKSEYSVHTKLEQKKNCVRIFEPQRRQPQNTVGKGMYDFNTIAKRMGKKDFMRLFQRIVLIRGWVNGEGHVVTLRS